MITQERVLVAISLATAFGAVVATIYLAAFWSTFGIDVLQFIGLADVVKLAIFPIVVGGGTVLGSYVASTIVEWAIHGRSPDKGGEPTKVAELPPPGRIGKWIDAHITLERFLVIIFIVLWVGFVATREPLFWIPIAVVAGVILAHLIERIPVIRQLLPDERIRGHVLLLTVLILSAAFGLGKYEALRILHGKPHIRRISTKVIKDFGSDAFRSRGLLEHDETLKFIGVAGEYFFFLREDNTATYAFKYDDFLFFETWK